MTDERMKRLDAEANAIIHSDLESLYSEPEDGTVRQRVGLSDWHRNILRRNNAAAVMEEACAEMARRHHLLAQEQYALRNRKSAERHYRLARRYLFALVGDGRGEDE